MKNNFLTASQLVLNKAGYLTDGTNPVTHPVWVEQQQKAHYIVSLAKALEGKTFKAAKLDDLEAIKASVRKTIAEAAIVEFVASPSKPVSAVNEEMVKYALDFANFEKEKSNVAQINEFMQQFNQIYAVEQTGDYFFEGLVKLQKIYTVNEILEAVKSNIVALA